MNQKIEKAEKLPLMESFYTIQGEGKFSGTPAYFIRLGGCDVGCHWCDVKESWDATNHEEQLVSEIVETCNNSGSELVVITGGEPLMYDLSGLTKSLKSKGHSTNIETSGVYPLSGNWDWICFSPKKFKAPRDEFYKEANELKIIVFNSSDFEFAEEHAKRINSAAELFLQPEWSKEKEMIPLIVEYAKENPKWRISLQTHKYMDIP